MKVSGNKFIFLVMYADGVFLATNDLGLLREVKKFLSKNFEMKDLRDTTYAIRIK